MKPRSPYPLLGFVISVILGIIVAQMAVDMSVNPLHLLDSSSFIIVFASTFFLYAATFMPGNGGDLPLTCYKMRWLQEVLILAGLLGTMVSWAFIFSVDMERLVEVFGEEDKIQMMGGGLATSVIPLIYALIGATVYYFIEKKLAPQTTLIASQSSPHSQEVGVRLTAFLVLYILVVFSAFYFPGILMGINPMTVVLLRPTITFLAVSLVLAMLYPGAVKAWQVVTWPLRISAEDDPELKAKLDMVRKMKRAFPLLCLVFMFAIFGFSLKHLGYAGELMSSLQVQALFFVWCLVLLMILYMIEGQMVTALYHQSGSLDIEDRSYMMRFVGMPMLVIVLSALHAAVYILLT
jgi:hypothetical protein